MEAPQAQLRGPDPALASVARGSAVEVLRAFTRLGLTSFGGPVAHLGYFRTEFVERRRWLDDRGFSDLVALCQFLPGPASSQVGMALGLARAGWAGALMAWIGFTLPSALALIAFAYGIARWQQLAESGWVHGLKVAAVAVVAQAVWGMARALCPDRLRAGLAVGTALLVLALPSALSQLAAIALAGLVGGWWLKLPQQPPAAHLVFGVSRAAGFAALATLLLLLAGLPLLAAATGSPFWQLVDGFHRTGALVFGGGHVVLPLLQEVVVPTGAVSSSDFLAGYGAAQAVPGPLFSFAAYLGAVTPGPLPGWLGGLVFLVVIFVPAFLLLVGALPFWDRLRQRDAVQAAMAGVNAGVVGILLAALYDPVWTSAIHTRADFAIALAAFALLVVARLSPVLVVLLAALAGWALPG
ncbi:chromate efflux transporter [Ramlibacter tataouinensis]|uniref:chromate efflux transporter n=1 Tax=Ramlibacter tataouinensis TaxID=94132 RepID=UPI0022F3D9BE|nr:chromate efflux transporter [Ramlibacter tataouinensis]WBY01354.1 chromate efflux transporter [Ramlibacter tataouinensis]